MNSKTYKLTKTNKLTKTFFKKKLVTFKDKLYI